MTSNFSDKQSAMIPSDDEMKPESNSEHVSFQDYESSNSKPFIPDYQSTMQIFPAPLVYNYQTKTWNSFYDNLIYKGWSQLSN